jgi:hypothetical protein
VKINFAHLCDYGLLSMDKKLSALGIFTFIRAAVLPAIHPSCFLVFEIELDPAEVGQPIKIHIQCVDTDGTRILEAKTEIPTSGQAKPGDHPTLPQLLQLPPLALRTAGMHAINIFLGEAHTLERTVSFDVRLVTPPAPSPGN